MKKWLDDLYAILLKRGFNTLDNVLKKYKSQIEEYEELKINSETITLNTNESVTFNFSEITERLNIYDRFVIYNRGNSDTLNFEWFGYKYTNDASTRWLSYATTGVSIPITDYNRKISILNTSEQIINFDLYIKKLC